MLHEQGEASKYGETKEARRHQFDDGGSGRHGIRLRSSQGLRKGGTGVTPTSV